ncbi:MAG: molybdopterin molybdotransferase MoeA [Phycisphaerae bacterium]
MSHGAQNLISLTEAWSRIAIAPDPRAVEQVPLEQAAGRVLAEPVRAAGNYPPFAKSVMDGYAVRAVDIASAPCTLRVVGAIAAGQAAGPALQPGTAVWINTGAPLPNGADTVVPVERTAAAEADAVQIGVALPVGKHVASAGSVVRAGVELLRAGVRLGPAQLGALAANGTARVAVFARPAVALVITGDELVAPGTRPAAGQIFDSNGPMLAALATACGAESRPLGRVGDTEAGLRERVVAALRSPIAVLVGGMSKGTLDLVPAVCESLGVVWRYQGVDMRPGRPTAHGVGPAGQQVFGLPGNPVSCLVCFLAFVRRAIDGLSGLPPTPLPRAPLAAPLPAAGDPRPACVPVRAIRTPAGGPGLEPVAWAGSGDPFAPARADGFAFQPRGDAAIAAGEWVEWMSVPAIGAPV